MFTPKYEITNSILNNIVKLEKLQTEIAAVKFEHSLRHNVFLSNKTSNIFFLARFKQQEITVGDAQKIAEGKEIEIGEKMLTMLNNFRNILEFNRSGVASNYIELDRTALLHLNKLVLTSLWQGEELSFRGQDEKVDPEWELWDFAASQDDLNLELARILTWYRGEIGRTNTVVVIATLVHRLLELMPFHSANQLTILALMDLLLYQYGYAAATSWSVLEHFHEYFERYQSAWQGVLINQELTPWLEVWCDKLALQLRAAFSATQELIAVQEEKNANQPFLDLNQRQLKILRYLQNIPTVRREDYCQMMEVSTMTAYRDLQALVDKKLLRVEGQGRGTKYMLVSR